MDALDAQVIFLLLVIALIALFIKNGVHKVGDGRVKIVERLGRRHKILQPGINVIIPLIDAVKIPYHLETWKSGSDASGDSGGGEDSTLVRIADKNGLQMSEIRMDPPRTKNLYTKDNTEIVVNSVAYFKVVDPFKLTYEVADFANSFRSMVETTLRQAVGRYTSDAVITSRDTLGEELREALQDASTSWGIRVIRLEIEEILFADETVVRALSDARQQELIRRAQLVAAQADADTKILEAEATRKAAIAEAEGTKQAAIIVAEGEKEAVLLAAQANYEKELLEAKGYAAKIEALSKDANFSILQMEAMSTQTSIANSMSNANTIVVPSEAAGLVGAAGLALKVLEQIKK